MVTTVAESLYQLIYRGALESLPEARAVTIGQALFKLLPVEFLPFRLNDPRLTTHLGGVALPNPLILSSMYYDPAILRKAMATGFGAVTTKSITVNPRPGHPEPNLVRVRTAAGRGFVNCNGFKNPGLAAYRELLQTIPHRVPLIVAVAGESITEYCQLVAELSRFGDLVECNISSPNTRLVYELSSKPSVVRQLFKELSQVTQKPLIVKLSPDFAENNYTALIPAAIETGIRIVNWGNTRRVEESRLSQKTGGLSGPELFPDTLAQVKKLRSLFGSEIEIIATGGVDHPEKALALLRAGATAVSYFTGFITQGPFLARRTLDRLRQELDRTGSRDLSGLRDSSNVVG
jgi:dihydroorotate dehydrogenase